MSTKPNPSPNPNPMRHCGRGSGCTQHYLNYDAKVYNLSLPHLPLSHRHTHTLHTYMCSQKTGCNLRPSHH